MAYAGVTILTSVLSLAIGNVISYKVAAAMIVKPPSAYTAAESAMIAEFADYRDLKGKFDAAQLPKADLPRYHELQDRVRRGATGSASSGSGLAGGRRGERGRRHAAR